MIPSLVAAFVIVFLIGVFVGARYFDLYDPEVEDEK